MIHPELNMDTQPPEPKKTFAEKLCTAIAIIISIALAALVVGYGLGEQAQLGERDVQTVTQEVRRTGDVKRLCLTVKTGGRIDAITCQVLDGMTGELK